MGAFQAIRYPVNATLNESGTILGTILVDEQSSALIRVELSVSPDLFSTSSDPARGDLRLTLDVSRSEVSPIQLP